MGLLGATWDNWEQDVLSARRAFHRRAEAGWTEFWTAAAIAEELEALGYQVTAGKQVVTEAGRFGLPSSDIIAAARERALANGAPPRWIDQFGHGLTGLVATYDSGNSGPRLALRFDIDATTVGESQAAEHPPAQHGFASEQPGVHHACAHDGHAAIGLAVAARLARERPMQRGSVKLIFQPAEEGVRGAHAMVSAGVLDDVETLVCFHIGLQAATSGEIVTGYTGFFATTKLDATFVGAGAHAGASPEVGRNALLAAALATLNIHALPRHSAGSARVNVGRLVAGEIRNSIPARAWLALETRGETQQLNEHAEAWTRRSLEGAAQMHNVDLQVETVGAAPSVRSDPALTAAVAEIAAATPGVQRITDGLHFLASDDATVMMERVQQQGGSAVYLGIGAALRGSHHTPEFDFDEACLPIGVEVLYGLIQRLAAGDH